MNDVLKEPVEIRLARAKLGTNAAELDDLSRDSFWFVRNFVATNKCTQIPTLKVLIHDSDNRVRFEANKNLEGKIMKEIKFENKILEQNMKEILSDGEDRFRYSMLDRMKQDCNYYLSYGNKSAKHLWAGNEKDHIQCMKLLWESFKDDAKPEWLTFDDINTYAQRMGVLDNTLNKDDFIKVALLQLGHYEEFSERLFLNFDRLKKHGFELDINTYEIIHLKNIEKNTFDNDIMLCNALYSEFNADCLRPADYYGHSLSISDVIVLNKGADEFVSYYVDNFGFKLLSDDFLSDVMKEKISTGIDVRKELNELLDKATGPLFNEEQKNRLEQLKSGYTRIFELADKRAELLEMQAYSLDAKIDNAKDKISKSSTEKDISKENDLSL